MNFLNRHFSNHKTLFPDDTHVSVDKESANKHFYQEDSSNFHETFLTLHVRYTRMNKKGGGGILSAVKRNIY